MPAYFSSVPEALDAVETDVLVEYTSAVSVKENVMAALDHGVGVVIGSSGLSAATTPRSMPSLPSKELG